ncbi:thiol reductant ABC exporter subunit CydC [Metabacillus sp. KIGAM252]|uniref:Thiol reductant ABC exporter subunit CydC n=1 Tax=Metabacillus flavus TaxID=2823519 RepID=A0ABS5LJT6_9BACI|nr:thiol reductant ABC exporter subunit CydC [Metabacillus flavus]MBS2971000.1 thiol reductant ABC exporter subunit CydC [Metabacillus flavus]
MKKQGWIMPYIKENRRLFAAVILLGSVTVFSAAFLMFTSGFLISKAATRPENILMIYVPIVAVRTFGVARSVSRYIERLAGHHAILKILSEMRLRLYGIMDQSILKQPARSKTGDILGLLAEDIEHLQDVYLKTVFPGAAALLLYGVSVSALGFFSVPFAGLMGFYGLILTVLLPLVSLLAAKGRITRLKAGRSHLYGKLTDAVMGISDWMFSGRQKEFVKEYEEQEKKLLELERQEQRFKRNRDFAAQLVAGVMIVSMLVWAGGENADGDMARTMIAAFVLVLFPLTEALLPLSDSAGSIPGYRDSVKRLESLDTESIKLAGSKKSLPILEKTAVCFENVSFAYAQQEQVLQQLSFTLKPGRITALLGPSGSGKSTIMKLLEGVQLPSEGRVTINGADSFLFGEEIPKYLAVLNQQPHLFDTSVLNNIRLGRPDAADEEVMEAAKMVQLHDYIDTLPNGFSTSMHETGMRFSGGERQRIALARILLQDTPIIVLDEPTVGLDPRTERDLLDTIFKVLKGKTVLWITHHVTGAEAADQILFLDEGRIVMEGTHRELLDKEVRYRRLFELDRPFLKERNGRRALGWGQEKSAV